MFFTAEIKLPSVRSNGFMKVDTNHDNNNNPCCTTSRVTSLLTVGIDQAISSK